MTQIILVRHGETATNLAGKIHSYEDTAILNQTGKRQIKKIVLKLKKLQPDLIYSSEERRSVQSAEILAENLQIPRKTIPGLQERNWGAFSGKSWKEVTKEIDLKKMTVDQRYKYIPPQGESWQQFEKRLIRAILKIRNDNPNRNIIIVTHMEAIRTLMPYLLHKPLEESFKYDPACASVTVIDK